jgi:O-antigen ligase
VRVLAETGLVGFAAYLLFLAAFALMAIRNLRQAGWRHAMGMALLTIFGIIVLASQFEGRFTDEPYLWLLVGVSFGLPAIHRSRRLAAGQAPVPAAARASTI